ncbi:MAG: Hsp20/alpha crystallin family protein [Anaerolineales bacterium]
MMRLYWGYPRHRATRDPIGFNGGQRLPIEVRADDEAYLITAEVPGMAAEDLQVEVLEDLVTLRGEYKQDGAGEALINELDRSGGFYRRIRLPEAIDAGAVEAKVENGLLTVRVPKAEEARPKRIEVKAK